jgi:phosphonate metabolism protein PhnM
MTLAEAVYSRRDEVAGSVSRLAQAALEAGVPTLSHDDMTPQMRAWYRSLGVRVAEFPIDVATAREAAAHGEAIVFGAPNVVRGGSHLGCPGAEDMVRQGLCTILASDYYYPALALAPFILARKGAAVFTEAWKLVSQAPAHGAGTARSRRDRAWQARRSHPGRGGAPAARRRDDRRRQARPSRGSERAGALIGATARAVYCGNPIIL